MPRLPKNTLPGLRLHKPTGQARVTLRDGDKYRDIYCGPFGSKQATRKYHATIAAWLGNDKKLPADLVPTTKAQEESGNLSGTLVAELLAAYLLDRRDYFTGDGDKPTRSFLRIKSVVKILDEHYGDLPIESFGPLRLKALRDKLVADPAKGRRFINSLMADARAVFRWGVSREMVSNAVYQALTTLEPLRAGKTQAREGRAVKPIDDTTVEATVKHVSPTVAAMVRLQLLTGMRPNEVVLIRPCDIERDGKVWKYRPSKHKTEHLNKLRVVMLGPKAQKILVPYLDRSPESFCFNPSEVQAERLAKLHKQRRTPMNEGNKPGSNRRIRPVHQPGECYTAVSYARAIARGCIRAWPAPKGLEAPAVKEWNRRHSWQPNRLRHSAGTLIREHYGVEAASTILGHSRVNTTEIYAEKNLKQAEKIAAELG